MSVPVESLSTTKESVVWDSAFCSLSGLPCQPSHPTPHAQSAESREEAEGQDIDLGRQSPYHLSFKTPSNNGRSLYSAGKQTWLRLRLKSSARNSTGNTLGWRKAAPGVVCGALLHVYTYTHAYFDDYKFLRTLFSNSGVSVKPNVLPLKASTRSLWVHSSESHRQSNEEPLQMPWLLRAMAIYQGLSASAPPQSNSSGSRANVKLTF